MTEVYDVKTDTTSVKSVARMHSAYLLIYERVAPSELIERVTQQQVWVYMRLSILSG
jgi:hypothetical protein